MYEQFLANNKQQEKNLAQLVDDEPIEGGEYGEEDDEDIDLDNIDYDNLDPAILEMAE